MKVAVTGATGFIGSHVVASLCKFDCEVIAIGRDLVKLQSMSNEYKVEAVSLDLNDQKGNLYETLQEPDVLLHLAWGRLDDFKSLDHFEKELPSHYSFLKNLISNGLGKLIVAGTCFEYGLQDGALSEDINPSPETPYAMAKDQLRRSLVFLQQEFDFNLTWLRYFYMFGPGQSEKTILSQLEKAINNKKSVFHMSGGEQLRDYLPVEEVAKLTSLLALENESGIFNICSGKPTSIRTLVEDRIKEMCGHIDLDLWHYPYPDYEPMAFWGDRTKLNKVLSNVGD